MKKFGEGQQPFKAIMDIPEGDAQELTTLTDQALNSLYGELFNLLQTRGINPTATTSADLKQVARAVCSAVAAGTYFIDSGTANIKKLTHQSGKNFLYQTTATANGFIVDFVNIVTNTDKVYIDVLDVENNRNFFNQVELVDLSGNSLNANELLAGTVVQARHDASINKFVLVSSSNMSSLSSKLVELGDALITVIQPYIGSVSRTQHDKNTDFISLKDFGCKGDGQTDDTNALKAAAAAAAAAANIKLFGGAGKYLLTDTVDLRYIKIDCGDATFIISHDNTGLILGGTGSTILNPNQRIGTILRKNGKKAGTRLTPDAKIMGAKSQNIWIDVCDFIQIYADASTGADYNKNYSSAYSNFYFKYAVTIDIYSINNGWINENNFYLNRTNFINIDSDSYGNNHNRFYNACMEGTGEIHIGKGNSNYFYNLRAERSLPANETLKILFDEQTWDNHVIATWLSSPAFTVNPYGEDIVTVIDKGVGNSVTHNQKNNASDDVIFSLASSKKISESMQDSTSYLGVTNIAKSGNDFKVIKNWGAIYTTDLIDLQNNPMIFLSASSKLFRPQVLLYDANKKRITQSPTSAYMEASGFVWNSDNASYSLQADVSDVHINSFNTGICKYAKIRINAGGSAGGKTFDKLILCMRNFNKFTKPRKNYQLERVVNNTVQNTNSVFYKSIADLQIAKLVAGVIAYKSDLSEITINIQNFDLDIKNIEQQTISLFDSYDFIEPSQANILYKDSNGVYQKIKIASATGYNITLVDIPPAELLTSTHVCYVLTKTKQLTGGTV